MIATALLFALLAVIFRRIALTFYDPWQRLIEGDQPAAFTVFILLYWLSALACAVMFVIVAWKTLP